MTDATTIPDRVEPRPARLRSLDVFRGLTIAGMILVNNQGAGGSTYPPLRHAAWDGWTPTDLVFPFFLLIVGVAIPFSFGRRAEAGAGRPRLLGRIVRRSLVIFGIGLLLNGFPDYPLATIRIPGVLQRIALCYLLASLVELTAGVRGKVGLIVVLLLGYWAAMMLIPVPGQKAGDLSTRGNLAAWVDREVLGAHIYKRDIYDPEGLLSTLPALATTLIGVLAGHWLRSGRSAYEIDAGLFVAGAAGVLLGWIWGGAFPINKALWTGPFVLLTAGLGLQLLAACYWLIDIKGYHFGSRPFTILGMNAIAAYVVAAVYARVINMAKWYESGSAMTLNRWVATHLLKPWLSPMNVSLVYGLLFVAACFVPVYLLDRKGIYLKA